MTNVVILPNIRSSLNVGSIFRTADASGVSMIYLVGYTPAPIDKFGRIEKQIAKTALGAEKVVPWKKTTNISKLLIKLKQDGFYLIAVEQAINSINYRKIKPHHQNAFIFGSEIGGLSSNILKKSDIIAEIPLSGQKESLNVSVTAGIVLFSILNL